MPSPAPPSATSSRPRSPDPVGIVHLICTVLDYVVRQHYVEFLFSQAIFATAASIIVTIVVGIPFGSTECVLASLIELSLYLYAIAAHIIFVKHVAAIESRSGRYELIRRIHDSAMWRMFIPKRVVDAFFDAIVAQFRWWSSGPVALPT